MKNNFKRIVLLSLIFNLVSASAKEQEPFNTGLSFGINAGYHLGDLYLDKGDTGDKIKDDFDSELLNKLKTIEDRSISMGLHIDYNYPLNKTTFIGLGLEANYLPTKKRTKIEGVYNGYPVPLTYKIDGLNHKEYSLYFVARAGFLLTDSLSLDANMAIVNSWFLENINSLVYNTDLNLSGSGKHSKRLTRIGFAPGIGLTVAINKNFSTGINYRYEIYPHEDDDNKIDGHNFFVKLSYHI